MNHRVEGFVSPLNPCDYRTPNYIVIRHYSRSDRRTPNCMSFVATVEDLVKGQRHDTLSRLF